MYMNLQNLKESLLTKNILRYSSALLVLLIILGISFRYSNHKKELTVNNNPSQVLQQEKPAATSSYPITPVWLDLDTNGELFGIDFSKSPFLTIEKDGAKRDCSIGQEYLIKNKAITIHPVCTIKQEFSLLEIDWVRQNISIDTFISELAKTTAEELAHLKTPKTGKVSVDKVKEENGISYYLIKVGDKYFSYRGIFFFETEKTKQLGVKIAIDDFGTGFSNYENILNLNIDYLKIDGSLIKKIDEAIYLNLIKSIVLFSKQQNIKVIAEFVSDLKTLRYVKNVQIEYSQGYHIGKPMSILELFGENS